LRRLLSMKKKEMRLLVELIKNSCRSDRNLAKVLGTSQPTVTRMRNKLVKEGIIQEFTVIPALRVSNFRFSFLMVFSITLFFIFENFCFSLFSFSNEVLALLLFGNLSSSFILFLPPSFSVYSSMVICILGTVSGVVLVVSMYFHIVSMYILVVPFF